MNISLRWVFIATMMLFGLCLKSEAQTFGSPQTVIATYRYLNITVFASTNPCLTYDVNFTTGLTLVTATASSDLTVSYY